MTPKQIEDFLMERNYEESAMREILTQPHFPMFSEAYIKLVLKKKKISINFLREMRSVVKRIDWNNFLKWHESYYTEEEKEKMKSEFNIIRKWGYWDEEK